MNNLNKILIKSKQFLIFYIYIIIFHICLIRKIYIYFFLLFPNGGEISPFLCEASYISENIPL